MFAKQLLANYVHLDMKGKDLILASGLHLRKVADVRLQKVIVEACKNWRKPATRDEVAEQLRIKLSPGESTLIPFALDILQSGPFLIESSLYDRNNRYSRHSLYFNLSEGKPKEIQERIKRSKVAVVGCGGIGNFMAVPLATAGVGQIVLVDHDVIELSNLTRQIMFTEAEVGKSKVEVLKKKIEERNSEVKVSTVDLRISTYADLEKLPKDIDLIVLSADGKTEEMGSVVFLVNKFCIENKIPFINVGYIEDIAVWGPLVVPGITACQNCERAALLGTQDETFLREVASINGTYQSPSSSPVNAIASSAAMADVLRFLGGYGEVASLDKRLAIRTDTFEKLEMPFHKNQDCFCRK